MEAGDPTLTRLDLDKIKLKNVDVKAIAAALPNSQVTNLFLRGNNIGAKGAKALAAALPNSQVTTLQSWGNNIGNSGAKAIAAALPNSQVTFLDLQDNLIKNSGAKAIAAALPNSQVTHLNLKSNTIGESGIKAIVAALPNSQVTTLELCDVRGADLYQKIHDHLEQNNEKVARKVSILKDIDLAIKRDDNYRPLDMRTGVYGPLAQELSQLTSSLNDIVLDWGASWSEMNPLEEAEEAKQELKSSIIGLLEPYENEPSHADGKRIHQLREELTEEQVTNLVENLHDMLIEHQERIMIDGFVKLESLDEELGEPKEIGSKTAALLNERDLQRKRDLAGDASKGI